MTITVNHKSGSYPILLERGGIKKLRELISLDCKVLIVTDDGVPNIHVEAVLSQCPQGYQITVPQGEGSKSVDALKQICEELLRLRFSRTDLIIAVGGGVVGDLAGFAASCYMRGIGFINIPTTTLSQIDSGIGGKTAVNLAGVKNCVGAFYQPRLVIVDPDVTVTLPARHFSNGLVEAVKAGLIADKSLFELFETADAAQKLDEIIERSLLVKKRVVEADEQESGLRKILNFGHTIGHGVESVYGLSGLLHGEAVAVGMLPMLGSGELRIRVERVLQKLGIDPYRPYDPGQVLEIMKRDKKTHGDKITVVRVNTPGEAVLEDIPFSALAGFLRKE